MTAMIDTTTRSASVPARSSSKEGSSPGLNESLLQGALLSSVSSKLSQMLGSSTEKSTMETSSTDDSYDEADVISLRNALAEMMISLEMYKVNVAEAQNSRTDSSMNIDKAIHVQSIDSYEDMLKQIAKLAKKKKKSGIFGVFGKVGEWTMKVSVVLLVGIVAGPAMGAMAMSLLLANDVPLGPGNGTAMGYFNEGLAKGIMACGCKSENTANIIAGAMSAVLVGLATYGAGSYTTLASTARVCMSAQQMLSQMQVNQVGVQIVESVVPEEKQQAWMIGLMVTNLVAQIALGVGGARAAGTSGVNAHRIQQIISITAAAGAISMGIGSIGMGTMQIQCSEILKDYADTMGMYSLTGNILESNGDSREEMDDHTQNLLQTEFDYSAYSKPGKELAKALSR